MSSILHFNSKETEESLAKWVYDMLVRDEADYLMRSLDQMVIWSYTDNVIIGRNFGQVAMGLFFVDILEEE